MPRGSWPSPSLIPFGADSCPFLSLRLEEFGGSGVGIAPSEVGVDPVGYQDGDIAESCGWDGAARRRPLIPRLSFRLGFRL